MNIESLITIIGMALFFMVMMVILDNANKK